MPFAHARSSSPTRLGMAAEDAERNGDSATADRKANNSSSHGARTVAIAKKQAAPARSEAIITFRRSNRSPSAPANGLANPVVPNVRNRAAATHAAEPVRS